MSEVRSETGDDLRLRSESGKRLASDSTGLVSSGGGGGAVADGCVISGCAGKRAD